MNLPIPPQPDESSWRFVQELQSPLWTRHAWRPRDAEQGEVSLTGGVSLTRGFADDDGVLETAYADLIRFLEAGGVGQGGAFEIATGFTATCVREEFRVEVGAGRCLILAADSEGIRRGIFHIEDEMLRAGGPFLRQGVVQRAPVVRTRISRCFFGPVKRPPKNRDELLDDVDYYPEEYLNRLAHDGVNALWLSVDWTDLCRTDYFPEQAADAEQRLSKLRDTVRRCARYGIKIYIFGIEPRAAGHERYFERYRELRGHTGAELTYFCTSSGLGRRYIEDALYGIFSAVPGLGGYINISLGERGTHCYSDMLSLGANNCPRCSSRAPEEVFAETLGLMARGMHRANPEAEFVSWLYLPYWPEEPEFDAHECMAHVRRIAANVPPGVTLQLNFESGALSRQFGAEHTVGDYSLAFVGPSELFRDCAEAAGRNTRVSAKLQVGCSHEVATVPFVPVPGNLYRKYRAIHDLGVSTVMQCWYFGNYPSLMTKAAGLLAFASLPASEGEFLRQLASIHWGRDAEAVAGAWDCFREAYSAFPTSLQFAWFGPLHDSICWPLHLFPADVGIAPSWKTTFPPSGDRIGECFAPEFTLEQVLQSLRAMSETWSKGAAILRSLRPHYLDQRERCLEIGIAEALELQIRSARNVMQFYQWREELPWLERAEQLERLDAMRSLVTEEIEHALALARLAEADSRLGFHSEAEGYKYFPAALQWRAACLRDLLDRDFPALENQLREGGSALEEFSGRQPRGPRYSAPLLPAVPDINDEAAWGAAAPEPCAAREPCAAPQGPVENGLGTYGLGTVWQAAVTASQLHLRVRCDSPRSAGEERPEAPGFFDNEYVALLIEPRRLWPVQRFFINRAGRSHQQRNSTLPAEGWSARVAETGSGWVAQFDIPFEYLNAGVPAGRPLRLNIERRLPGGGLVRWQPHTPLPERLVFVDDNPADYGWLLPAGSLPE